VTDQELQEERRAKWRLDGRAVRTIDDARDFIESVGFCLMYPLRPAVPVPTFIGAAVGAEDNLPTPQHAFADPRTKDATDIMVRLLRQRFAFEANVFGETNFLVSASAFPYFYGLVGDRNPRQAIKLGPRAEYSTLAAHTFQAIQKDGPITKQRLRENLGGDLSEAAIDRALNELWSKLRITRVDYSAEEGASWDILFRWAPDQVREGMNISMAEALTALISKYIECIVAAEQTDVEEFFSNFVSRSKAREAINALLAARELQYTHVGGRSMLQITQARAPIEVPKPREIPKRSTVPRPGQPIARRPGGRPRTAPVRKKPTDS
jgi:Winged helix DNA-binding domain